MSATNIIATAPLGALICYTDGSPKPPAGFTKKLAAWERSNGVGRLVKKEPPRLYSSWKAPAPFTLHEGNFASDGVIFVTIMRSHSSDSTLVFEVAEEPEPEHEQVRVLLDIGGNTELLHLAESVTAAVLWIAKEGYRNARLEMVGVESNGRAGGADLTACGQLRPMGPPKRGHLIHHNLVPRSRGAPKQPSPSKKVFNQELGREGIVNLSALAEKEPTPLVKRPSTHT